MLRSLGVAFEIITPPGDEPPPNTGEAPASYALRAATTKGLDVLHNHAEQVRDRLLLASDTVVTLDGIIYGKPDDEAEAREMLRALSGKTHQVLTGIFLCLFDSSKGWKITGEVVSSQVTFHPLAPADIEAYIETGEPMDKAGSYALQGEGARLVKAYAGSRSNIVGLPLERLRAILSDNYGMAL